MEAKMKVLSALSKVFLDEEPLAWPEEPVLSGFRNEVLSFQVAYRSARGEHDFANYVNVSVESPLKDIIRVRRVEHVPVGLATFPDADEYYLRKTSGVYPDRLVDVDKVQLRLYANQWQSLWFDVEPLVTTRPGVYPIDIFLKDNDGNPVGEAHTQVEILPGLLPRQELLHTKWLYCDCIAEYYQVDVWSERFWEILENFVALAVRRGINMILTPIHTPSLDTAVGGERLTNQLVDVMVTNGRYSFGFDRLRRWVEMCKRCGVEYYEMSHLFTQWGATCTPKIIATVDGQEKRIFGWDVPASSDAYRAFIDAYLPALTAELKKLGIAEATYFHISDEPSEEHLEDYRAAKNLVAPYLEGFEIIDALSSYEFYKQGVLTKPIPANNHIQPFIDNNVPGLWTYYCVGQYKDVSNLFIAQPSSRNRIFGVQLYKYDIEGILQWGYNFYNSQYSVYRIDPYAATDADGFVPAGDPFQVYPGADGQPVESIRIMVTQQAIYDLRACKLLESLTDKAFVMELIEGELKEPITFASYPRTDGYLLSLRARINREIAKRL